MKDKIDWPIFWLVLCATLAVFYIGWTIGDLCGRLAFLRSLQIIPLPPGRKPSEPGEEQAHAE